MGIDKGRKQADNKGVLEKHRDTLPTEKIMGSAQALRGSSASTQKPDADHAAVGMWTILWTSGRACGTPILFFRKEARGRTALCGRPRGSALGLCPALWTTGQRWEAVFRHERKPVSFDRPDPVFSRAGAPRRRGTGVEEGCPCGISLLFRGSFWEKESFL